LLDYGENPNSLGPVNGNKGTANVSFKDLEPNIQV